MENHWGVTDDADQRNLWLKQLLVGLPGLMGSVVSNPLLTQLWEEYRSVHEAEALAYRDIAAKGIETVKEYLRPKTEPQWSVVFVPNLLDSYSSGYEVDARRKICRGPP